MKKTIIEAYDLLNEFLSEAVGTSEPPDGAAFANVRAASDLLRQLLADDKPAAGPPKRPTTAELWARWGRNE